MFHLSSAAERTDGLKSSFRPPRTEFAPKINFSFFLDADEDDVDVGIHFLIIKHQKSAAKNVSRERLDMGSIADAQDKSRMMKESTDLMTSINFPTLPRSPQSETGGVHKDPENTEHTS